jgi:hypothetical protein
MRKTVLIALGAAIALVSTAVAVAAVYTASGVGTTAATLATTQATNVSTRSCTGGDGKAFTVTQGRYTGTANFTNPATEFDGPLTISARTVVEGGSKLGYVEGSFRVRDDDTRLSGWFWGTLDSSGKLAGFLSAGSRGNHARVLGTLSGTFAPATGFVGDGLLGSAPSSAALAVVAGPVCKGERPKPPKPSPRPKRFEVKGTLAINGNPATSVTVTAKGPVTATCTLDGSSPSLTGFASGDRVEMKCEGVVTNNTTTWMLRGLKKHR